MPDDLVAPTNEQRLRRVLDAAGVALATLDEEGHVRSATTEFAQLWGHDPSDIVGLHLIGVVPDEDQPEVLAGLVRILEGVSEVEHRELRVPDRHDRLRHLRLTFGAANESNGRTGEVIAVVTDLTSDQRAERRRRRAVLELARSSTEDPATGLRNQRGIEALLASALRRSARQGYPFAVMLVDFEGLDALRATLSSADADQLTESCGARLSGRLRPSDEICRSDDTGFVVVAEDLGDVQDAAGVAYRLLSSMVEPLVVAGDQHTLALTIGLVVADGSASTPRLLATAREALTEALGDGRGGFRIVDIRPGLAA